MSAVRDLVARALLDFEHDIVPYDDADAREAHRPAQLRRADRIIDQLAAAGYRIVRKDTT